jgi:hypothetical protein
VKALTHSPWADATFRRGGPPDRHSPSQSILGPNENQSAAFFGKPRRQFTGVLNDPARSAGGATVWASDEIVLPACDGLDPEFDMLGGKVEVRVERPDTRGMVPTPGEDAVLVATELRTSDPV